MGLPIINNPFKGGINIDRKDLGTADTIRYNVLRFVVEENYDRAILELKKFREHDSPFPKFKDRCERYISHSIDLVNAIRAKRKFPGMNSLTAAKQQELNEKFHEHFKELQIILRKVELIQQDLKVEDIRSTVYVLKAFVNASFAIAALAFLLEVSRGLFATAWAVFDDGFSLFINWVFSILGI